MAEEGGVDFSAQVQQHADISDKIIRGQITMEEGLPQLLDVIPLGSKDVEILVCVILWKTMLLLMYRRRMLRPY